MSFLVHMLGEGLARIAEGDRALWATVARTLWLTLASTAAAGLIGIPLGLSAATRGARPASRVRALGANLGLGLPPVVLGIILGLLLLPGAPLGWAGWLTTLRGVWLAQVLLATPLVVALTAAAAAQGPAALDAQARALGAGAADRLVLLARELRPALLAALLAAALLGLGEVGAVIIIGGNVAGHTNTLASSIVLALSAGDAAGAVAAALLLGAVIAVLTWALGRAQRAARSTT